MKQWLIRNITKPFEKRFKNGWVMTAVDNGKTWCGCATCTCVSVPLVILVLVMLVMVSIDTMRSSNAVVFSIGRPGKQSIFINGVYKMAYERSDGSIDVVFNIPNGAQALMKANISATGIDPEVFNVTMVSANSTSKPPVVTTPSYQALNHYPVTLDADYVINPVLLCHTAGTLDYIVIVHSATAYFERRRVIRETFAAKKLFGKVKHRILFLLGQTNDPKTTRAINQEAIANGDILQGAFADSYHNLTHKGVMGYRWLSEYCLNVKVIVKIDDDVFMNPFQFVFDYLPLYSLKRRSIACHVRPKNTSPIERGKGKWQVKNDEFRGHSHFPVDYCNGYYVIFTPDLLRSFLRAVPMNPFFWIDDVYLYGMLPATVGNVTFTDIRTNLSMNFAGGKTCYSKKGRQCNMLGTSQWKENEKTTLWHMVLDLLNAEEKKAVGLFQLPDITEKMKNTPTKASVITTDHRADNVVDVKKTSDKQLAVVTGG